MKALFWKCPVCDRPLSCGEDEDPYDVRFDSREVGGFVTFHHCGGWRKARIESIEEVEE